MPEPASPVTPDAGPVTPDASPVTPDAGAVAPDLLPSVAADFPVGTGRQELRVAVIGAGVVGGATALGLLADAARPARERRLTPGDGLAVTLVAIGEKYVDAAVAKGIPRELVTPDSAGLLVSPNVDAVVETIGGDEPARTFIADALAAGKAVVTANKHVIAHHGPQLEAIARRSGAPLRFEAAVGGGIPVLGPLSADLGANRIDRFRGIVNGTTNYILTAMARDGSPYADVLAAAQRAGYAEADPTGDVEGADAVNKLVILVRLAFGVWIRPEDVTVRPPTVGSGPTSPTAVRPPTVGSDPTSPTVDPHAAAATLARPGITGVTADTIAGAASLGLAIKLVASGERRPDGRVVASVLPTAVPLSDPFANTSGVLNRIELFGDPIGGVAFEGPGAGGPATSSAVIGDLLAIARGDGSTWAGRPAATQAPPDVLASPLDADAPARDWFAVATIGQKRLAGLPGVLTVELDGILAVHLAGRTLEEARAVLAAAGAPPTTPILPAEAPRP